MGSNDEFGPDTETIRAWLNKRATYTKDAQVVSTPRDGDSFAPDPSPPATPGRLADVTSDTSAKHAAGSHRSGPDGNSAGRSVLAALGAAETAPASPTAPPAPAAGPDGTDVGRSVVDALRADPPATTKAPAKAAPRPEPTAAPKAAPAKVAAPPRTVAEVPAAKAQARAVPAEVRVGRWTEPVENLTARHASTDVDFPARKGGRRILSLLLLAVLGATGVASYLAWEAPTTATVGVAATLGVLTLVVWAVRASVTTVHLALRGGQLHLRRGGRTEVVDIASGFTPIAILGRPGQRRWKVLIERADLPLLTITPAMVDPHWFTTSLYRLRPDLRPEVQALEAANPAEGVEDADPMLAEEDAVNQAS